MTYTWIIPVHKGDDGGGGNNMSRRQAMSLKQQLVHGWFQCTTREMMSNSNLYTDGSGAQLQVEGRRYVELQMQRLFSYAQRALPPSPFSGMFTPETLNLLSWQ